MSNKEKGQKLELKDCVAIKHGWLNTLWHLCIRALIAMLAALAWAGPLTAHRAIFGGTLKTEILGMTIFCWIIVFMLVTIVWRKPFTEYWRRNVVGYTMVFTRDPAAKKTSEARVMSTIVYDDRDHRGFFGVRLVLPLGGWLRRPFFSCSSKFWVKLAIPYHRLSDLESPQVVNQTVFLCDERGARWLMHPEQAFEILCAYGTPPRFVYLDEVFNHKMAEVNMAREELKRLGAEVDDRADQLTKWQRAHEDLERRFDDLVHTTIRAITEILKTSRFRDLKEGARMRKLLSDGVRSALLPDDPRLGTLSAIEASRLPKEDTRPRKPIRPQPASASRA